MLGFGASYIRDLTVSNFVKSASRDSQREQSPWRGSTDTFVPLDAPDWWQVIISQNYIVSNHKKMKCTLNTSHMPPFTYRQISNISHALVGNKIVDHSDVVGASPIGAAPTTSSFSI